MYMRRLNRRKIMFDFTQTVLGWEAGLKACKFVIENGVDKHGNLPAEMEVPNSVITGSCGLIVRSELNDECYTMTIYDGKGEMHGTDRED